MTATVGLIVRSLENRAGVVGRIVFGLVGMAWSIVTFMVVPVLLFEDLSVTDSVKRSATLFRSRWGEQLVGNGSIGLVVLVVGIVALIPIGLAYAISSILGFAVAVVLVGALMAANAALSGIFNAALYRYATTGLASSPFEISDLQGSFRARKGPQGGANPGFVGNN
jgi:hypothetical protein